MKRPYGRDYVNRAFARAQDKNARVAEIKKSGGVVPPKIIKTAPVQGDPEAIDWLSCDCGYEPPLVGGKKPTRAQNPAYLFWTENKFPGKSSLLDTVKTLAIGVYRVGWFHPSINLADHGGWPDLTLWGPYGCIIRELKAMKSSWQPGQKQHLLSLREAGFDTAVWKPCCLLSGRIDDELAALVGCQPKGTYARTWRGGGTDAGNFRI